MTFQFIVRIVEKFTLFCWGSISTVDLMRSEA